MTAKAMHLTPITVTRHDIHRHRASLLSTISHRIAEKSSFRVYSCPEVDPTVPAIPTHWLRIEVKDSGVGISKVKTTYYIILCYYYTWLTSISLFLIIGKSREIVQRNHSIQSWEASRRERVGLRAFQYVYFSSISRDLQCLLSCIL